MHKYLGWRLKKLQERDRNSWLVLNHHSRFLMTKLHCSSSVVQVHCACYNKVVELQAIHVIPLFLVGSAQIDVLR